MELTFTGTGAAYYPELGSTSAYFVKGNCLYLIDCGETTFSRLFGKEVLHECSKIYVLVTHIHADHIGSLGSFISYCKNVLHKNVTVLCPDTTLVKVLELTGVTPDDYTPLSSFSEAYPGHVKFTPVLAKHDPSMRCYGYFIQDEDETIYYGADSCGMPTGVLDQLEEGSVTRIYQEVTYKTHVSMSHTSLEQLVQMVPHHLRSKIICMHFGGDYVQLASDYGFGVAIPERAS